MTSRLSTPVPGFVYPRWARLGRLILGLTLLWSLSGMAVLAQSNVVRLVVVITPNDSGLLEAILPDFEKESGYRVEVYATTFDVYDIARSGKADIVISHYGFREVESFIRESYGLWPRPVFADQAAVLGPPGDPARIRGLEDAVEGFRRIAEMRSLFVVNNNPTIKNLIDFLWEAAGRPERGDWYIDRGLRGAAAVRTAAELGAYTLWGLEPFLHLQESSQLNIEALLIKDALLQRIMASILVNPERVSGVNFEGARALQRYLLSPVGQARVRAFRYKRFDHSLFWPAALHN